MHCLRQVKESLLKSGLVGDNIYCHILSGLGAGFFAVICGSPVDVVKSRLMGASPPLGAKEIFQNKRDYYNPCPYVTGKLVYGR